MYTVGYAWMYGTSMLSGSYQVLALAMFSHLFQMVFLTYVEDPHIQRTYGLEFEMTKQTHNDNIFILRNFDPFRASDLMMVMIFALYVVTTIICGGVWGREPLVSEYYFLGNALFSTLIGRVGISCLLYKQGKTKFWTAHFLKNGLTLEQGFNEWKRVQNLIESVINISYLMLAWRVFQWTAYSVISASFWSYFCVLLFFVMLNGVSYWSSNETYSALGDFGWFYGDFFCHSTKDAVDDQYIARGIYRYFKHPDMFFGKCWLYAFALLCESRDLFSIAMLNHALCLAQVLVVEEPHMKRIYQKRIRNAGIEAVKKVFTKYITMMKEKKIL